MTFNPGRNIGRVSIRVVPDTKHFNRDVKKQLGDTVRNVRARVRIDGADFDRAAVTADIEKQLASMQGLRIEAQVQATVDSAKVKKALVRKSIQAQFDDMAVRVGIEAHVRNVEGFQHDVRKMVDDASNNKVQIPVVPHTAQARAELQYAARNRVVNFFVQVNQGSLKTAAASIAALSGARIAGNWLSDIADMAKDLDKNLPKIIGATTGITSLVAGLTSLAGGFVSVGQGLFSITPALLVIPGLAINAVGSLSALIVAWKDAGNQLAPLAGGMREIGEIINTTYWDQARQPILDLVNGLMPQMRNAFRDLSQGVGEFTGALAKAFGDELSGGRFESIFGGIAEGWRVLGTGASGFAGAIVSLSQIAATYTPRLAAWFVRQANTFDAWLQAIAKDGRLGAWMEGAIDSMYDLWDATKGIAGVFEGIYTAAAAAGSEGLEGFARLMQQWERTVKSADFQKGLSAVFRGSYAAMDAFGEGIKGIGRLIADLSGPIERFIGGAGGFLGGLVEGIANALNSPVFGKGLDDFTNGLAKALEGIKPSLQPIADTFGGFVGLLGDMAGDLLPAAAQVIADLTPALDGIVSAVRPVLPELATALTDISSNLAPAIADFVEAASPAFQSIVSELAQALVDISPGIAELARVLGDIIGALTDWSNGNKAFFDDVRLFMTPDDQKWKTKIENNLGNSLRGESGWVLPKFDAKDQASVDAYAGALVDAYKGRLARGGPEAGRAFLEGLKTVDMPSPILDQLKQRFGPDLSKDLNARGREGGGAGVRGIAAGIDESPELGASIGRLRSNMGTFTMDADTWLTPAGAKAMQGFRTGSEGEQPSLSAWFAALGTPLGDAMAGASTWLLGRGGEAMGGFRTGADGGTEQTKGVFSGLNGHLTGATGGAGGWLTGRGSEAMGGFGSGAEGRKGEVRGVFGGLVSLVTGAIPNPLGLLWGAGSSIMSGFLSGLRSAYEGVKTFVSGIAGWIAANKGPEAYDRQLLVPAGGWIMEGFQRGLERGFGRVQSRVAGMAGAIRDQFATGLSGEVGIDLGANAARSIAASAKARADQDATARAAQGVPQKVYNLHGLTTRETAEEIAEEIDKKDRRTVGRGAFVTAEVR